jgi:hypothetical protein
MAAVADVGRERERFDERAVSLLGLVELVLDARKPGGVLVGIGCRYVS